MSIEKLIADNTAAVLALTSAIRDLIDRGVAGSQGAGSAPVSCPPPAYGPACPAEEAAAVAEADAVANGLNPSVAIIDEPQAVAASANHAPVSQAVAPVDVAPSEAMTLEQLRGLCIRAGQAGLTADVLAFLRGRGLSMLADLPASQYGDLVQFLAAKGVK